ncbi:MAG: isoaspartyl peptidase/L-asparaginase [Candidatus Manganitrophus sp.]|nr:MAG: isoaspartyl peptidase/L-asparaginase [Candidatus Manganitrophus sp.]
MKKKTRATVLLIHGGCGSTPPTAAQLKTIETALDRGERLLQKGASALDAVEAAVVVLEKSGRFNAGKGSKRQMDGVIRTDASVMNGRDLSAGAVAAMEGILTPIRAARLVMERTPHLLLVGISAEGLARLFRLPLFPLRSPLRPPLPRSSLSGSGKRFSGSFKERRKMKRKNAEPSGRWRATQKGMSRRGPRPEESA